MTTENKLRWRKCAEGWREADVYAMADNQGGGGMEQHLVMTYRVEAHGEIAADGQSRIFRGYKCAYIPPHLPNGMIGGLLRYNDEPISENNPAHDAFIFDEEEAAQAAAEKDLRENFDENLIVVVKP